MVKHVFCGLRLALVVGVGLGASFALVFAAVTLPLAIFGGGTITSFVLSIVTTASFLAGFAGVFASWASSRPYGENWLFEWIFGDEP